MNMPAMRDNPPWSGPVVGAIVGTVLGVIGSMIATSFTSQSSAEVLELREHDQKISRLEVADLNRQSEVDRLSKVISEVQLTQTSLSGIVTSLKDATDELMHHTEALQKSYTDIRDALGPVINPSIGGRDMSGPRR